MNEWNEKMKSKYFVEERQEKRQIDKRTVRHNHPLNVHHFALSGTLIPLPLDDAVERSSFVSDFHFPGTHTLNSTWQIVRSLTSQGRSALLLYLLTPLHSFSTRFSLLSYSSYRQSTYPPT